MICEKHDHYLYHLKCPVCCANEQIITSDKTLMLDNDKQILNKKIDEIIVMVRDKGCGVGGLIDKLEDLKNGK